MNSPPRAVTDANAENETPSLEAKIEALVASLEAKIQANNDAVRAGLAHILSAVKKN